MARAEPRVRDPNEGAGSQPLKPMALSMTRRLVIASFAVLLCAGTAIAAAGDPEKRAIRPADQAWAKRVNLTYRDLPGAFVQQGQ